MRSYFCRKCNYEFDVESNDDQEDVIFCPKCTVTVAEVLPETPERIIARSHRIEMARQQKRRKLITRIILTLIALCISAFIIQHWQTSFWGMLTASMIIGCFAGIWVRSITANRSWIAGVISVLLLAAGTGFCLLSAYFCGSFLFTLACRNLIAGVIPAWIIAIYEN